MNVSRARRPANLSRVTQRRHKPDYWLLLISVALLVVGLIVVYAISPGLSVQQNVSENYYVGKQILAIGLGAMAFAVVGNLPLDIWRRLEKPLIIACVGASLAVRLLGEQVNGAYRWVQVGGLSFQPAELIKFTLLIWLAGFLVERIKNNEFHDSKKTFRPLIMALAVVGVIVAGLQSDLGSTGVMVAIMACMIFVVGLPFRRLAMIGAVIVAGTVLLVAGTGYRRQRLSTFLSPANNCQTTGYQSCQALIAVGSGGIFGLGLARSVQAYGYLPEAADDSIFAIYAEKFGFIGVSVLLLLFMVLFARLKNIIERAPDTYTRLLVTGILAWLSTQLIINVGAMVGLLPLKGITLPFISYGGTSVVFIMAAIGLAFQVSRYTSYSINTESVEGSRHDDHRLDGRRLRGAYNPNPGSRG